MHVSDFVGQRGPGRRREELGDPKQIPLAVLLTSWSQLRRGETLAMQRRHIDIDRGVVRDERSWTGSEATATTRSRTAHDGGWSKAPLHSRKNSVQYNGAPLEYACRRKRPPLARHFPCLLPNCVFQLRACAETTVFNRAQQESPIGQGTVLASRPSSRERGQVSSHH